MNHWRKQIVPFRFAEKLWPRPPAPVHPLAPGGYHCFITRRCLSALLSNRRCRQHPQLLFCTNGNCEYSVSIHLLHSIHPSFVSSSVLGRELLFRRRASWCFCLCGGGGNGGEANRTEHLLFLVGISQNESNFSASPRRYVNAVRSCACASASVFSSNRDLGGRHCIVTMHERSEFV